EFFAENSSYWYATNSLEEAYYLSAILNSDTPNTLIKDFQTRGLFGARNVHKKILDLYYPRYDAQDPTHRSLAELGHLCHEKTAQFLMENPPPSPLNTLQLGKLRTAIRRNLSEELKEMDVFVQEIIPF
ncbi:MAG: hypothetical protein RL181_2843, partial [Bacteroidota bacterium]